MNFPDFIADNLISERFQDIEVNAFFLEEFALLENEKVCSYYHHIISNIDINKENLSNSYILWIVGKVDKVDKNTPCKIIKGNVSLPDIDIDVPAYHRDDIIQYIKNKYGHDKVCQMVTFQTMKGRGALKNVLRAHNIVTPTEMNIITKHFPQEAKIIGELQTMKEEDGESSIIRWTLENDDGGNLKEWCYIDEGGNLQGELAQYFEQAIRLEGTKFAQSKHAAGILISPLPLSEVCPMIYDSKADSMIAGLEMNSAAEIGLTKYDVLGLNLLDKLMGIQNVLRNGNIL